MSERDLTSKTGFRTDKQRDMIFLLSRVLTGGDDPGDFDAPMLPYLMVINSIPFVYSLQSCTGHHPDERKGAENPNGQIWLRLDCDNPDQIDLSRCPFSARWLLDRDSYPILDIRFPGLVSLHNDMMAIIRWLIALAEESQQ